DWDSLDACSKTKPFEENERKLEGMDYEMRRKVIEQVVAAKENAKNFKDFRLEALDVIKIALMKPDRHPGSSMYANPFANDTPSELYRFGDGDANNRSKNDKYKINIVGVIFWIEDMKWRGFLVKKT
nr:protein altered xyloglucan 4 [Tanacetum cinerariifolium]